MAFSRKLLTIFCQFSSSWSPPHYRRCFIFCLAIRTLFYHFLIDIDFVQNESTTNDWNAGLGMLECYTSSYHDLLTFLDHLSLQKKPLTLLAKRVICRFLSFIYLCYGFILLFVCFSMYKAIFLKL